jgi:O-antigen/teichoic acid export membrane protein
LTTLKQVKQLSKDTLIYGMGSAVQGLIVFLLFPIYTRALTQEDFGAQDLVLTAVTVVTFFLMLGLDSGTARHYYEAETPGEKRVVLSTWLWFEILISIPICLVLIKLAEPICVALFNNASLASAFRLGIATIPFTIVARVFTLSLRLTFQAVRFGIVIVVGALAQALVAILLVSVFQQGIGGVFMAMMASNLIQAAVGLALSYHNFQVAISGRLLRSMLAFGVPLVPASLSLWILNYSNRYFLTFYGSILDVAIMGAGVRVATIMTFVITAFRNAWPPFAYSLIRDVEMARRTYARVLTFFLLATMLLGVGLSIFAREVVLVLATSKYEASASIVPWLVFSAVAWGVAGIVGIGFEIAKKSFHFSIATILGAGITTLLNIALIPKWGVDGAAIATLAGNLVAFGYAFQAGQRHFHVPYEKRKIIVLVLLAFFAAAAGVFVNRWFVTWQPALLVIKAVDYFAFLGAIVLFRVVSWDEIRQVLVQVRARFFPGVSQEPSR